MAPADRVHADFDPGNEPRGLRLFQQEPVDNARHDEEWPGRFGESRVGQPAAQVVSVVPGEVSFPAHNQTRPGA